MENSLQTRTFDLAIIGNGIAAQTFLWNLENSDSKSQNFSIAHVYSEELAPACTLRSSATVSLNGIDADVSPLGNDMREAYFLFDQLYKKHAPDGVEEVKRVVITTNENDTKKLTRRYKKLSTIKNERIINEYPGVEYNSYLITPVVFFKWMQSQIKIVKTDIPQFVRDLEKKDGMFHLKLENGDELTAKKVLFATGAFAKIFEKFYTPADAETLEIKNTIKAGSYLEKEIDLGEKSFYLSIDGHLVLYRKNRHESKLIIGNVTTIGAFPAPDLSGLKKLLEKIQSLVTFDVGQISDYKITTGLRHKGPKRLLICEAMENEKQLFRINGLYKNGFTLSFLAAERMRKLIFNHET